MSPPHKRIAWFAVKACAIIVAGHGLWLVIDDSFGSIFRAAATGCVRFVDSDSRIRFVESSAISDRADATLVIPATTALPEISVPLDSRDLGYMPALIVAALTLATPVPSRRLIRSLVIGLALCFGYCAFRLGLGIAFGTCQQQSYDVEGGGLSAACAMGFFHTAIFRRTAGTYAFPVFIWLIAALREDVVKRFLENRTPESA